MSSLERNKAWLVELNKLISEAEQPGAYINSLAEERQCVERNIRWQEEEVLIDEFFDDNRAYFASRGVNRVGLGMFIKELQQEEEFAATKTLGARLAAMLEL